MDKSYFLKKKIFATLFFIFALKITFAHEGEKIKVGYFFSDKNASNAVEKIRESNPYEFLQKISTYTGWDYEFVVDDFPVLLEQLRNGQLDIMTDLYYTDDRAKDILYSTIPEGSTVCYIIANSNDNEISDVKSIQNKKVGFIRGSDDENKLRDFLKTNKLYCNLLAYPNNEILLNALVNKEVDVVAIALDFLSRKESVKPKVITAIGKERKVYFGVSKKNLDIYSELEFAMQRIATIDKYYFERRYNTHLRENLFIDTHNIVRTFLEKQQKIVVGISLNHKPFTFYDESAESFEGVYKEVFEDLQKRYNIKYCVKKFDTYDDMIKALQNNEIDVACPINGMSWIAEEEKISISDEILTTAMKLIYLDKRPDQIKRIAVCGEVPLERQYIAEYYPYAQIIEYSSTEASLEAVINGTVDAKLIPVLIFETMRIKYEDYLKNLKSLHLENQEINMCLATKRGNFKLIELLNLEIAIIDKNIIQSSIIENSRPSDELTFQDILRRHASFAVIFLCVILFLVVLVFSTLTYYSIKHSKTLEKAEKDARFANESKTNFLSRMSHDIRTPINAIIGMTTIAKDNIDQKSVVAESLRKISTSSQQLNLLVNEILDISRLESGKIVLQYEPFDINDVLDSNYPTVSALANEKSISLLQGYRHIQHPRLIGSAIHLNRIIMNIISNSIKYNRIGGKVISSISEEPINEKTSLFTIIIKDTGIGMSQEFLCRIFEPFSREHETISTTYDGSGLGMTIVKELVDLMGGTISIKSKINEGTEFIIKLRMNLDLSEEKKLKHPTPADFENTKILLVEDNEVNREIASYILEKKGMKVTSVENGKKAVDEFRKNPEGTYNVILMDIRMPEMNGLEATKIIRAMTRSDAKTIPIIAMTANAFSEDIEICLKSGMNAHISKPINVDNLLATLEKYI